MRRRVVRRAATLIVLTCLVSPTVWGDGPGTDAVTHSPELRAADPYTLIGEKNLIADYEPLTPGGDLRVVVEIPTGTLAKWEVIKPDGTLKWEFKKGRPRVVRYLGYPGNYGMVPRTLLPETAGGDGDPLDVIVLGPAVPRGSVIEAKLIGVLKLVDQGERDDKLIAVLASSPLYEANTLQALNETFPGVSSILEIWFQNYKGPGKIDSGGFGDCQEARSILDDAMRAFGTAD
jgi:inorganic pyrophosphatase